MEAVWVFFLLVQFAGPGRITFIYFTLNLRSRVSDPMLPHIRVYNELLLVGENEKAYKQELY